MGNWLVEALRKRGGTASVIEVSEDVWTNHQEEIQATPDLLYTWQYDLRWAATQLRANGLLKDSRDSARGRWELASKS